MTFFSFAAFFGGLAIVAGAIFGQAAAPSIDAGQTSVVIVLGGAITAAAAVAQKWLEDKKNAREIDLAKHKLEARTDQHMRVNVAQYKWMVEQYQWDCRLRDLVLKMPGAPEIGVPPAVPSLPVGYLRTLDGDDDA